MSGDMKKPLWAFNIFLVVFRFLTGSSKDQSLNKDLEAAKCGVITEYHITKKLLEK